LNKPDSKNKKGAPGWAVEPFKRFLGQAERMNNVVRLSVNGISVALAAPKAVDAIAKAEGTYGSAEHQARREAADRNSALARREVDSGFQLIFSFATVALWSLLEAMLRDVVVSRLKNDPRAFDSGAVGRLRIRLGEYEQLAQEDRCHYVAESLEADLAGVCGMALSASR